ncbi:MAG: bifunctional phosphoribosylaminoimidazolecarboxamide formyltransferase/IMP cyclohydrolase [Candidatus Palauibacterales bacterium]|nr:bifunctional phosphoribosylaminoimidazolecarboxamide formyltransferase/IMP cyclohydrolase [Candidatus Palauibacterales bacterium]
MPNALISVSDKSDVEDFARGLVDRGWQVISTGGTAQALDQAGIPVESIRDWTGFPEIMGGRVKTLHPAVHAGLLARRSVASDMDELEKQGFDPIDLVAVNLYPFRETIARPEVALAEAMEQVDIGGPTMLRAAAKNHSFVWPVCDPDDYGLVLETLDRDEDSGELRRELASKVFRHTATYDAAVGGYLDRERSERDGGGELPEETLWSLTRDRDLRYGENPDQEAALYRSASREPFGIPALEQHQGRDLSYNNLQDLDAALRAVAPFAEGDRPACAIMKHLTPCGIAVGRSTVNAYEKALASDPMSAYGSVIAFTEPVTEAAAEAISELFVECVVAPGYASAALRILRDREKLRVLEPGGDLELHAPAGHVTPGLEARGVEGGVLVQTPAEPAVPGRLREAEGVRVASKRQPDDDEWEDLAFAWAAAQSVKSNAILLARDRASVGIGAGQMSRVDAVEIAIRKARQHDHETEGAVLASDAFFPFRDGVDAAAEAGVRAVIQPGGSIRDDEVVEAADEHGMAMVLTGRRVFRH